MIRRGFWLVVGAAGGIAGYRRASRLGRQVSETLGARPKTAGARKRHWARESIRFASDVREGMDLYFDRQLARSAPTLDTSTRAVTPRDRNDEREDH
jgi:hypothetical protein